MTSIKSHEFSYSYKCSAEEKIDKIKRTKMSVESIFVL